MLNRLFGKKEEPKVETPVKPSTPTISAPVAPSAPISGSTMPAAPAKGVTMPASLIKEKVKEGEKWLKHVTTGEMAKYHALYTTTRKNQKTGLDEKVTVCTEVDCEKNKPQ